MTFLQVLIFSIIQGITEFFPISSSGHLLVTKKFFSLQNVPLSFDVFLHFASLLAILVYFRKTIKGLLLSVVFINKKKHAKDRTLLISLCIATIPIIIGGLLLKPYLEAQFSLLFVLISFVISGTIFIIAEYANKQYKVKRKITWIEAVFIGFSQVAGVLPGISRSGITTGTGLFLGISRQKSAEFAFLLGIPAILGATIIELPQVISSFSTMPYLLLGFSITFFTSLLSISFLMQLFKKYPLSYFSIYLFALVLFLYGWL